MSVAKSLRGSPPPRYQPKAFKPSPKYMPKAPPYKPRRAPRPFQRPPGRKPPGGPPKPPTKPPIAPPGAVRALRRQMLKSGFRALPWVRVGMGLYDFWKALQMLQRLERENLARPTKYGLPLYSGECPGNGPVTVPFWGSGYASCAPLTQPYQQANPNGDYIHINWKYPNYPQYWRQKAVYGPVPKAQRLPLTARRSTLLLDEPLSLPELDPNVRRHLVEAFPKPDGLVQISDPTREPQLDLSQEPRGELSAWIGIKPGTITAGHSPQKPPNFPISRPPSPGMIEKKVKVTKHMGAQIFKALDTLSESLEKVDCIYKALPKKYQVKKSQLPKRGLLDTAGQYGIDHADIKIPLIYKHFDEVNWPQALHCIGLNEIEDKLIGRLNADLRKVYRGPSGQLTAQWGKTIAKVLDPEKGFLAYDGPGREEKEAR